VRRLLEGCAGLLLLLLLLVQALAADGRGMPTLMAIMTFCTSEAALQRGMWATTMLAGLGLVAALALRQS
jgi:hypothetical protein